MIPGAVAVLLEALAKGAALAISVYLAWKNAQSGDSGQ